MNDPFEPRIDDLCFVEVFDRKTGEIANRLGPMNYRKAEKVEDAMRAQVNYAEYDTRQVRVLTNVP